MAGHGKSELKVDLKVKLMGFEFLSCKNTLIPFKLIELETNFVFFIY